MNRLDLRRLVKKISGGPRTIQTTYKISSGGKRSGTKSQTRQDRYKKV